MLLNNSVIDLQLTTTNETFQHSVRHVHHGRMSLFKLESIQGLKIWFLFLHICLFTENCDFFLLRHFMTGNAKLGSVVCGQDLKTSNLGLLRSFSVVELCCTCVMVDSTKALRSENLFSRKSQRYKGCTSNPIDIRHSTSALTITIIDIITMISII